MVRSLRFWGTASHLLVDEAVDGTRQRNTKPTNVATALLQPGGLDPYMENTATWWWLHWLLTGPDCQLPVWWMIIHDLPIVELDEDTAVASVPTDRRGIHLECSPRVVDRQGYLSLRPHLWRHHVNPSQVRRPVRLPATRPQTC